MLLCTRCKKRPAVVFVSNGMDSQNPQGLCLVCAKELGIKPVNDIMEKMGITDEELEGEFRFWQDWLPCLAYCCCPICRNGSPLCCWGCCCFVPVTAWDDLQAFTAAARAG